MSKHLEEIREISYYKLGIIDLIEKIENYNSKQQPVDNDLSTISLYLKYLVEGAYSKEILDKLFNRS